MKRINEKKPYNPFSNKNAIIASLLVSLLMHTILFATTVLNYSSNKTAIFTLDRLYDISISYLGNALLVYILFRFSFWVVQKKWVVPLKYVIIVFSQLTLTVTLSIVFSKIFSLLLSDIMVSNIDFVYKNLMIDIIYSIIVFLITVSISEVVKNQNLSVENFQNRHEALKNQLDPHFLFNSLNVLDGLIGFDDKKAHDYLQNLSFTFRHTIQPKKITQLDNELRFVEAYVYLLEMRYGDCFGINYNIENKYLTYILPHISLQLLVENAVKHNIVNDRHPLSISIETTPESTIKVLNNKNSRPDKESGNGIGLKNLEERYNLEFNKKITITETADDFSVEIPLVFQTEELPHMSYGFKSYTLF